MWVRFVAPVLPWMCKVLTHAFRGWSTTLLTSKGSLHTAGVLDGQRISYGTGPLHALSFPEGYPTNATQAQYEEPTVAIRQFSSGRAHILALSDSGRLWSWFDTREPALQVKFATLQINELSLHGTSMLVLQGQASCSYWRLSVIIKRSQYSILLDCFWSNWTCIAI